MRLNPHCITNICLEPQQNVRNIRKEARNRKGIKGMTTSFLKKILFEMATSPKWRTIEWSAIRTCLTVLLLHKITNFGQNSSFIFFTHNQTRYTHQTFTGVFKYLCIMLPNQKKIWWKSFWNLLKKTSFSQRNVIANLRDAKLRICGQHFFKKKHDINNFYNAMWYLITKFTSIWTCCVFFILLIACHCLSKKWNFFFTENWQITTCDDQRHRESFETPNHSHSTGCFRNLNF